MPRLYKGTETVMKLYVPHCDENNIDNLKIGLFTDDATNASEFHGSNMEIDGDTVYIKVNTYTFDLMNDGIINYVIMIETDTDTIIEERQSNYFLRTPNEYTPTGVDLSNYYTKDEVDKVVERVTRARVEFNSGDVSIPVFYGQNDEVYFNTVNGESILNTSISEVEDLELETKEESLKKYNQLIRDYSLIKDAIEEVNETLSNKIETNTNDIVTAAEERQNMFTQIAEVDRRLYYVEDDKKNYYTKSEVDEKIDNIETSDIDLSDYYTKTEVDNIIGNINNILETI